MTSENPLIIDSWPAFGRPKRLTFFSEGSIANSFLFRRVYQFRVSRRWPNYLEGVSRRGDRILRPIGVTDALDLPLVYDALRAGYRFSPATSDQAAFAGKAWIEPLFWLIDANQSDYIYETSTFRTWPKAQHQKCRQYIRALTRQHLVDVRKLTLNIHHEVIAFLQIWKDARKTSVDIGDDFEECLEAIGLATRDILVGYCVYVDARLASFLIVDHSIDDMLVALFLKADRSFRGAGDYCLQAVCELHPEKKWINLCQDLGILGLRRKKIALCPERIVEKLEMFF